MSSEDTKQVKKQRTEGKALPLLAVGFCGVDDSVEVASLTALSKKSPWIEWGVLFRPEKAGEPRFGSVEWVEALSAAALENSEIKLAGHLCSTRCEQVLDGDSSFVKSLFEQGFRRVQVNATAANGVDTSKLSEQVDTTVKTIQDVPDMEFILQRNKETQALVDKVLDHNLKNVSVLFDDSVGTGVERTTFPSPATLPESTPCGYAGGIGPKNIERVLKALKESNGETFEDDKYRAPWIDMESSLRAVKDDGKDVFSLDNVQACVDTVESLVKDNVISFN